MGNMLFSQRVADSIGGVEKEAEASAEHRIFAKHMYSGPMNLGDPEYRGLSKMETDPLISQRMRDVARTELCVDYVNAFSQCGKREGLKLVMNCRLEKDEMVQCMEKWFFDDDFRERVTEEYLNERSHFRQTGIKTQRYKHGKLIMRDLVRDPPLDASGKYRPRKPTGWDEAYKDGLPKWTNYTYT